MDDEFMGEQRHSRDSGEDVSTCMIESNQSEDPEYFRTTLSQQFRDPCSDIPDSPPLSQDPKYDSNYGDHPQDEYISYDMNGQKLTPDELFGDISLKKKHFYRGKIQSPITCD